MSGPGTPPPTDQQEEIQRLRRAVEELSILNDLARAIGSSLSSQEIMHTIIHRSLRAVGAEQGVITLVGDEPNQSGKTLVRTVVSSAGHPKFHLYQALEGWMHINKKPLMINDPANDPRFRGIKWDESIRSLLSVPMIVKSSLRGLLTIYNKKQEGTFSEGDQRLLAIIAAQSAQVIETARLYELEKSLVRMKEELRLAATIQTDLLPKDPPLLPGYDIAGKSVPAQVVGGDYFDFIPVDDHRTAICLGDVSGKGLPAALLMANLQATLRGVTLLSSTPRTAVERANKLLYRSTSSEKFVTLFYGVLDIAERTLCYSNAGHDHPFLYRLGGVPTRLSEGGVVLSIMDEFPFQEETIPLGMGDLLVIYSDGIVEAINPEREQFGQDRLAAVIQEHQHETAASLIECIIAAVNRHAGETPQADDMTVVVVKGTPPAA
jgi:sigma-B regulation protein RsbU (phosphoserine phosphatase)